MAGSFKDLLEDLFWPLGGVSLRKMFGGVGVFKEGIMFALVSDDTLYMKTDPSTLGAYEAEGSAPFVYEGMKGKMTALPYWRLPERLYDDPADFDAWARAAFGVAERAKKPEAAKKAAPRKAAPAKKKKS
jgi:DNA transformation protein